MRSDADAGLRHGARDAQAGPAGAVRVDEALVAEVVATVVAAVGSRFEGVPAATPVDVGKNLEVAGFFRPAPAHEGKNAHFSAHPYSDVSNRGFQPTCKVDRTTRSTA